MSTYIWENVSWSFYKGKPTIFIFARDVDTYKTKRIAIQNVKPYFYISSSRSTQLNCFGKPIDKVICTTPMDLTEKRNKYKAQGIETFNSDIPYEMQYLIEKKIVYGFDEKLNPVDVPAPIEPRTVFYDIELNIPEGEPIDDERARYPIVAIATLDTFSGESKVFTIGDKAVHDQQVTCNDEQGLIRTFFNYIEDTDPDILAGWNSVDFDLPYIIGRAKYHDISTKQLNRTGSEVNDRFMLSGRTHIDMMVLYKLWNKPNGQLPSYSLKYVAKHVDNFEYEAFGSKIQTLIANNDWHTLVEYNLNDVIALQKINAKCGIIIFYENLRRLCGIKFDDVTKNTKIVETLLLRHGIKPIPPLKKHEAQFLEGAYVKQPTMGIKRNVATYDAASLYPSIILAKDLSPDIDKMLPKVITFILNEREKYRELKLLGKASESDKTTEQSLKYIANSFYGVCASPYFKLYNMEIASTITRTGREILKSVEQEIEGLGYNVIYADTDGSFVENVNTLEDAEKIKKHINTHLKQWATQHKIADGFEPFVKFEKWFSTLFFKKKSTGDEAAKKKYVGRLVYKDGHPKDELSYTGIEIKRSDTAPYTKTIMESFFKKVLIDGDAGGAVEDVRAAYIKVKNGKVPAHDIAIPKAVHKTTNNTAHVKGMNHGIEVFGIRFNSSKKPKLLYCKSPFEEVCVDDETTEEQIKLKLSINYEKQADRVVSQKMRSLIESLGYNWEKIIGGQHNFNDLFGDVK